MTARAVATRPAPAPVRVPAVASTAIEDILRGTPLPATVLGTSSHAAWLLAGDRVVVVTTRDATRLPNGVEIAEAGGSRPFDPIRHGSHAVIGSDRIRIGHFEIDVVRWWDPRPVLAPVTREVARAALRGLPSTVYGVDHCVIGHALATRSPIGLIEAVGRLLGRGPGLTPEADDYVAGALAATRIVGEAMDRRESIEMLDAAAPTIRSVADDRTTTFSAALVGHAVRGQVAAPASALLRAIAGRGDVATAHRKVLEIGHTSGPALAAGMVLGTRSLIEEVVSTEVLHDLAS